MIRYETFINKRVRPGSPSNQEVNRDESFSFGAGDKRVTQGRVATQDFKSCAVSSKIYRKPKKTHNLSRVFAVVSSDF